MRNLTYFIALSIDGFIAGPDDEVDFYAGSDEYMQWMTTEYADALPSHGRDQHGLSGAPLIRFDTVVMGRRTYEPALQAGITSPYPHLRQIVFSRTLDQLDPTVSVVRTSPLDAIRDLKKEKSELGIYLAGGGLLAGELVSEIDFLVIKRYPVVIGAGKPAFGPDFSPTNFVLDSVQAFAGGNLVETYSRGNEQT